MDMTCLHIMGIINLTPDSFYEASQEKDVSSALETATKMDNDGASILDLGGESSKPGAIKISADEEQKRVIPSINEIKNCLEITSYTIEKIKIRKNILDDEKYKYIFSVENLNNLVSSGMAFRDAYTTISNEIKSGNFKPDKIINHKLKGSINNLCLTEIKIKMNKFM